MYPNNDIKAQKWQPGTLYGSSGQPLNLVLSVIIFH